MESSSDSRAHSLFARHVEASEFPARTPFYHRVRARESSQCLTDTYHLSPWDQSQLHRLLVFSLKIFFKIDLLFYI